MPLDGVSETLGSCLWPGTSGELHIMATERERERERERENEHYIMNEWSKTAKKAIHSKTNFQNINSLFPRKMAAFLVATISFPASCPLCVLTS